MPRLKSGRHVCLSASPLLDKIKFGTDVSTSAWIMLVRLAITSPQQLRGMLRVGYFGEFAGDPLDAPSHDSGFSLADVLSGKADWSSEEISEFDAWLNVDPRFEGWLAEQFTEIDAAIRDSLVWETPFWTEDESAKASELAELLRSSRLKAP